MAHILLYLIAFTALNSFLFLNANYIGTPKKTGDLQVVLKQKIELKCEYNGEDGDGQFLGWYKDGKQIDDAKSGPYVVETTKIQSKLTITINETDRKVKKWYVQTGKPNEEQPVQCQFPQIKLRSSPQRIETDREAEKVEADLGSVRRVKHEKVIFKCILAPKPPTQSHGIVTEWKFSKDNEKYVELPDGVHNTTNENEIVIERVEKTHKGYYRCTRNNVTFTALLRVKDPFAALWPFLIIVSIVLVLVTAILIFEKRQKAAKKAAAVENEGIDNANDPLVQSANKSTDNEIKKQIIKV